MFMAFLRFLPLITARSNLLSQCGHISEIPPVLLGIPWPALGGPLRNHFWKKKRPQPYWGGDNSGNALEPSNALNYRAWGIPAVLSTGIPGNALRAFPGSFRNFFQKCPAVLGVWPNIVFPCCCLASVMEGMLSVLDPIIRIFCPPPTPKSADLTFWTQCPKTRRS